MGVIKGALSASRWGFAHPTRGKQTCLPEGLLGWLRTPAITPGSSQVEGEIDDCSVW